MVSADDVKRLRERTGAGVMDCKRALQESGGDVDRAIAWLREKGLATAARKAGREAREGVIASYIHHGNRLGALVELNCETDFVARNEEFQQLARELAMAVAGHAPLYVSRDDVPSEVLENQRRRFVGEAADEQRSGEPPEQVAERRLDKWLESVALLEQPYRDTDKRIGDLITEKVAVMGENIRVARFARLAVGETADGEQPASAARVA
jgi:elongation factor Ts